MNRRALLASFLAAPVAVRLGRWVKPAPVYALALRGPPAWLSQAQMRLGFAELYATLEQHRLEVTRQFVDAACLTSKVPLHA